MTRDYRACRMTVGLPLREMSGHMMYPEYGATVQVHITGENGTIVGVTPLPSEYLVLISELHYIVNVRDFTVLLAPSVSAYELTRRHSVDEVLASIELLADLAEGRWAIYLGALVVELMRLNFYAEAQAYADQLDADGWESGTCPAVVTLDADRGEVTFWTIDTEGDSE
jgi:hypothetical protein